MKRPAFHCMLCPWLCPWIPPHLVSAQAILGFLSFIPSMALYLKGIVYFVIDCSCIFIHSNQLCLSRSLTHWQSNYWLENSPDISLFSTSLPPPMLHPFLPPLVFSWLKCGQRKTMCGSLLRTWSCLQRRQPSPPVSFSVSGPSKIKCLDCWQN